MPLRIRPGRAALRGLCVEIYMVTFVTSIEAV